MFGGADHERRIKALEDFVHWPSIDPNNEHFKRWIEQTTDLRVVEHNVSRTEMDTHTRDVLQLLLTELGYEVRNENLRLVKKGRNGK